MRRADRQQVEKGRGAVTNPAGRFESTTLTPSDDGWGSLDELPQLLNVIRGEMNIVGPRPERPSLFADLRQSIPAYEYRQQVKPGITGLAQVSQQYDTSLDDVRRKVKFDLEYLRRQSLWEDVRIMAKRVPVILFKRGGW